MERLKLHTWQGDRNVNFKINSYSYGGGICIDLDTIYDDGQEHFGSITVNFAEPLPPYYGYLNVENMPDIRDFVERYGLGRYTGIERKSGFCKYPLYKFNSERLSELCPEDIREYEIHVGIRQNTQQQNSSTQTKRDKAKSQGITL